MVYLPDTLELTINLSDEQFFRLCQDNRDLRFERTSEGDLIIMSPTGGNTGRQNIKLSTQLELWSSQMKLGVAFDSNTGFKLPNGANRSPDASWIKRERWEELTPEEQDKFVPLCPDFVLELRSPSDSLKMVQAKVREYMENGARLGWLIDPQNKVVEIYRPNQDVEIIQSPKTLSGEDVLPGFTLNLSEII
ncbi:MAG: Uma2 family endonuclease [Moorea sp. SIO3I7]|uniref:Uma2 family endonuclease n=1 Tax=unclassified Moorena TaxID=2683338 RepID=UPI0013C28808|nr:MULTISPECIES: Uma2 family endonuclease [unclassified Moorena]NEN94520.1 Uma2 family endonuclease [Moorena sp. SIO3I7]NEO04891.1 Uma2 family endonuclease [Moorena sp. SIO3I8]NEP25036.1 Uma2 family endonuclease [Moorena sp. SIO3I6]